MSDGKRSWFPSLVMSRKIFNGRPCPAGANSNGTPLKLARDYLPARTAFSKPPSHQRQLISLCEGVVANWTLPVFHMISYCTPSKQPLIRTLETGSPGLILSAQFTEGVAIAEKMQPKHVGRPWQCGDKFLQRLMLSQGKNSRLI